MTLSGIALAFAMLVSPCDHRAVSGEYDAEIKQAVAHYWPMEDRIYWCDYKAQLYVESALDPNATSPVGARGLAQVMPTTWKELAPKAGLLDESPYSARGSIRAGAYYLSWLGKRFTEPRDGPCENGVKQAAYNTGARNVWRAQTVMRRRGYTALCFDEIRKGLPEVTGKTRHGDDQLRGSGLPTGRKNCEQERDHIEQ